MQVKWGLSLKEIDWIDRNTDIRVRSDIVGIIDRLNKIERIERRLDIAEAVQLAFGSVQSRKNQPVYTRWRNRLIREMKKLAGNAIDDVWGMFSRRSKKL